MQKKRADLFSFADSPLLFAHRGCSKKAPENTLAAFQKVLDNGVPGVEFDVHQCRTGELVVIHDSNVRRVTGHEGIVEDMDLAEIRELDAGAWFSGEFTGEKIPLLEEVLDLLGDRVYYDIEIKQEKRGFFPIEERLVEMLNKRGMKNRVIISSFNPYPIKHVRQLDQSIHTAHIYADSEGVPRSLRHGAGRFFCRPEILKPDSQQVHRWSLFWLRKVEGYPVLIWTVDDTDQAEKFISMGVDGLISNVPEKFIDLLSSRRD